MMNNKTINVFDNFLSKVDFISLKSVMLKEGFESSTSNFPWYFIDYKVTEELKSFDNFQFVHMFYDPEYAQISQFFNIVDPILKNLNVKNIVRIKANLNLRTEKECVYGYHIDYPNCKTAIYYVNSNNGYTMFSDGTKIESVENRLVLFDSNIQHTGVSSTDTKIRCVINFNYH